MTMKHEPADDFGIGKWNDQLGDPRLPVLDGRDAEGVSQAIEMRGDAVYLGHQKSGLMDMKVVILRVLVNDGPFLRGTEPDDHVCSILVENLVINHELRPVRTCRKNEGAPTGDRAGSHHLNI